MGEITANFGLNEWFDTIGTSQMQPLCTPCRLDMELEAEERTAQFFFGNKLYGSQQHFIY